ncbi:hypothetical protein ERO13_A08G248950v2 [Gossypium hirsutum]|nr:hypothetical protein ERO13_A08G248950v2 [Gossypium hirsutum]
MQVCFLYFANCVFSLSCRWWLNGGMGVDRGDGTEMAVSKQQTEGWACWCCRVGGASGNRKWG